MQLIRACNPNLLSEGWRFVKAFEDPVAESSMKKKGHNVDSVTANKIIHRTASEKWRKMHVDRLSKLHTERELLSDSREDNS